MASRPISLSPALDAVDVAVDAPAAALEAAPVCLNCDARLAGDYCAACGQRAVDLAAPTWQVVRDAMGDVTDVDGRLLRTGRALLSPGRLTLEFLRGRRAAYVGPLKLFVLASTALTTTWILTRGADARFYGLAPFDAPGAYIDVVVRGTLASTAGIAAVSWALARGRRRVLDEVVFAIHLVATLSMWASTVIWLATGWKLLWGSVDRVPSALPALPLLFFVPAGVAGLLYTAAASRRVHGGPWWAVALRAVLYVAVGVVAVTASIMALDAARTSGG